MKRLLPLLLLAGCATSDGTVPSPIFPPVPKTPVEACNLYDTSVTRQIVLRRIERGQIAADEAGKFMALDAQLGEFCAAVAATPEGDVMAAYRAFILQAVFLASDSIG